MSSDLTMLSMQNSENKEEKACPLLSMRSITRTGNLIACAKKKCMWYIDYGECAINKLAKKGY